MALGAIMSTLTAALAEDEGEFLKRELSDEEFEDYVRVSNSDIPIKEVEFFCAEFADEQSVDHATFAALHANILEREASRIREQWPGVLLKDGWAQRIEEQYEEARRIIRTEMRRINQTEEDLRIDRHKVGSALVWAILRALPFTYSGRLVAGRFANEELAFRAAIGTLISFGYAEARKANDAELMRRYKSPFRCPPSSDGPYREHVLKVLHLMRQGNSLNLFVFSNLLFVLEQYHLAVTPQVQRTRTSA